MDEKLSNIARRILGVATLETRGSDGQDFHDISVWTLRLALEEAFLAGRIAALTEQAGKK